MKKYESVRNGQVAELISETEEQVILKLESGEERAISPLTLKRWWKALPEEELETEELLDEAPEEEDSEEAPVQDTEAPEEEPAKKETKKQKQSKEEKDKLVVEHPLKAFVEKLAQERNTEVFEATVKSFRSLKVEGKMYMAFTFNSKGVNLWMRSKAVEGLVEYKTMKHMFDARVQFTEDNQENRDIITKLLDASLQFQKDKIKAQEDKKKSTDK